VPSGSGAVAQHFFDEGDARSRVFKIDQNRKNRVADARNGAAGPASKGLAPQEAMLYVGGAFVLVIAVSLAIIYGILYVVDK
jgi:hypothetical protein